MAAVAEQTGTPLVDLHAMSLRRWDALGPAGTREEFLWLAPGVAPAYPDGVQDGTHFQAAGAVALARLVARDLQRQRLLAPGDVHHLRDALRRRRPGLAGRPARPGLSRTAAAEGWWRHAPAVGRMPPTGRRTAQVG